MRKSIFPLKYNLNFENRLQNKMKTRFDVSLARLLYIIFIGKTLVLY